MAQSPLLRIIPLLFYRPHVFWSKSGLLHPAQRLSIITVFIILSLVSAMAGIGGRFIFSISEPDTVDYLPEALAGFIVPYLILMTAAITAYILAGRKERPSFRDMVMIVALSMIPLLTVWTVILFVRYLFFFGLLGLFSLYVFRSGLSEVLNINGSKASRMTLVVFLVTLPVYVLSDLLCRYLIVTFVLYAR